MTIGNGDNNKGDNGPNAGAIAGGVIGGLAFVAILTYFLWKCLIKPKRAQSVYDVGGIHPSHDTEKDGTSRMERRLSSHTVHSIASTVLTRASNIIQIAYIPGVTNRANPSSPRVLVPPVPPIPMQHSGSVRDSGNDDQHFFVPGDLRDSTYSGLSGYSDRTSFARTSYAPRSSIASTIYGKQAQVMTPGQTGMRVKPTMVSVKSVGVGSNGFNTPPVPSIDFEKFSSGRPKSGASTFSVGSTFLNTATQARAQVVKVGGSGLKQVEIGGGKSYPNSVKSGGSIFSGETRDDATTDSGAITLINGSNTGIPTVMVDQGPFSDPPESQQLALKSASSPTLGAVIEIESEEDHRASGVSSEWQPPSPRASSPFGDEHATK